MRPSTKPSESPARSGDENAQQRTLIGFRGKSQRPEEASGKTDDSED